MRGHIGLLPVQRDGSRTVLMDPLFVVENTEQPRGHARDPHILQRHQVFFNGVYDLFSHF